MLSILNLTENLPYAYKKKECSLCQLNLSVLLVSTWRFFLNLRIQNIPMSYLKYTYLSAPFPIFVMKNIFSATRSNVSDLTMLLLFPLATRVCFDWSVKWIRKISLSLMRKTNLETRKVGFHNFFTSLHLLAIDPIGDIKRDIILTI